MAGNIFINYRRGESSHVAGRLHERLAKTFGRHKLFMDVDNMPVGIDFEDHLKSQVAECDAMLTVIGPNWLDDDILVDVLRDHRKAKLELHMKLGAGKLQNDGLLFTDIDGAPLHPYHYGTSWSACAEAIGFPEITFHALRHTHVSQLVDQGVDIVTVSRRIGHANPEITLRSYSHLFRRDDGKASAALNAIFKTVPA
jgi:hypothetical protein